MNKEIRQIYEEEENILVENVHSTGTECYIFFSSNGLYRNIDDSEIGKKLVEEGKYEWKSLANAFKYHKRLAKIIYVRDVYISFYVYGVSRVCNTLDKVIDRLRMLSQGYQVTTVGISSGGYMATICALKLSAKRAFCIAGQFDLTNHLKEEDKEFCAKRWGNYQYMNICKIIEKHKNIPVFYFCSSGCPHDYANYQIVRTIPNVYTFLFPDKKHAATVYPFNFPDILFLSNVQMYKLYKHYQGKLINKKSIYMKTVSLHGIITFLEYVRRSKFNIVTLKKKWDV